jgi:hypothetical protein
LTSGGGYRRGAAPAPLRVTHAVERGRIRALTGNDRGIAVQKPEYVDGARQEKRARSRASNDGRGWFRTSDLSRVKRALSH